MQNQYRRLPPAGSSNMGAVADMLIPQEPWEYALMAAAPGPGAVVGRALAQLPKAARAGSLALGIGTTATEAQAGKGKIAKGLTGFAPGDLAKLPGAPAIVSRRGGPTPEDIAAIKEAAVGYGRKGWPEAERGVFKTTPEAYAETTQLVPQISIKDRLPGPLAGEKLPLKGRADPIVENTEAIAERIAQRLEPMVKQGDERLKFYHTAPVIRGLEQYAGMSIPEANTFMRGWAGQGAATSPRTQTPPNLRNSSYLGTSAPAAIR